ncbi:T9SS type A sorting domain-containing protein [Polaribacter sp.]|uniref:T9SS type A sorting domain-containing protein n=1 Tax=Polaribacter sp. TaxID=1920175 RepID=UPI00404876FC
MKKSLLILMLFFCALAELNAQTAPSEVCTSPTSYNYDEQVTWYFNLEGNTSVTAGENLYFYSWLPQALPNGRALMTHEGNMLWSLTFTPTTLYGLTVTEIEAAGDSAFWGHIQNQIGTVVTGTIPYNLKEQLRLGNSCSGIAPSSSDSTFLVNFGSEPITNPDINSNHWTNVQVKTTVYDLIDKGGTGRYQITATGSFTANNNSAFINPDANILGDMAIASATKSYLFLSGTGTGTITISGLETNRLHKLSIFGSRNTTSTRETRYTVNGLNTESGVLQTSGVGIATNPTLNTNDDEFYVVNAFPNAQGEITIDVEIVSGGFGYINMLKIEEVLNPTLTFNGSTNSDWGTATNWNDNVIPTALYSTVIPASQNVTISGATNAVTKDLSVDGSGSLTINSGGTLIVSGTSTGNVTYNSTLGTSNLYLMGSPFSGVTFDDTFVTNNNIDSGAGNNRGVATYTTADNTWSYLQSGGSLASTVGIGYAVKQGTSGTVAFTGTVNTSDVSVAVSNASSGFNLISNPFSASINSATFLTDNTANLVSETIWVFNQVSGNYETKVTGDAFILPPTQGFFVRSSTGTNLTIAESYQTTGGTFQKSAKTEVKLLMSDGTNDRFAKVYYVNNATKAFDNGWEGETFGGIKNSLDVFSQLVEDNQGKNYQVQSLPISEMESITVPIGITAAAGKEITFSTEALNLPADLKVFLEDREKNSVTRLDNNNSYKVTLNSTLDGVGRFYLHTKSSSVLSSDSFNVDAISIYTTNKSTIRIVGLSQEKTNIKLFNILGKQVLNSSFKSSGVYDFNLPNLTTGIYIVQLENKNGTLNKKIVLE